jgi:hypothetical protein
MRELAQGFKGNRDLSLRFEISERAPPWVSQTFDL